ncbi:MAG: glycosyltransferase family 39 protein [bacterium]|jgi:hypothetical protein|nr:glycosyltransferase family 39 protein [bacterium]
MNDSFDAPTCWLLILVILLTAVPFLNKAYHIDDTFVLAITQEIINDPLNPLGGEIDWTGEVTPILETTTNPVFISYFLAPFAAISGFNEMVLHAAMMVFLLLLGFGAMALSNRFANGSIYPVLFVLVSPAVMVSGNVMRDTPALGLAIAGLALFIQGTDKEHRPTLCAGAIFTGLAVMTKYSAIIMLPVLLLYPFFQRKYRLMIWVWPLFALIALWCLHNQLWYGTMHMVFLAMQKHHMTPKPWQNKLWGMVMLFGSILYLIPLILYQEWTEKRWPTLAFLGLTGILTYFGVQTYWEGKAGFEYLFWSVTGGILLLFALWEGFRTGIAYIQNQEDGQAADSLFLFAFLCAPVLFSIFFVPFQAVRHLLLAMVPLTILVFRSIELNSNWTRLGKGLCLGLLIVQGGMGFAVHYADTEYANVYRHFATFAKEAWAQPDQQTWYVGHWGWKYYADRAGFQQVHRNRAFPKAGDILLWPQYIHAGHGFETDPSFKANLELIQEIQAPGSIPLRTMNRFGAKFYATIWCDTPYCLGQTMPLDTLQVFRVREDYPQPTP